MENTAAVSESQNGLIEKTDTKQQQAHGPGSTHRATVFGPPRNFLNNRFVYAVISQRARGLSIGINMNPDRLCNFDCMYCEVNRNAPIRDQRVDLKVLSTELQELLTRLHQEQIRELPGFRNTPDELLKLKEVALSGDGEPTLSPDFAEIVREVVRIRSLGRFSFFKIVLITNATGLDSPEVRLGLQLLTTRDEIWVKLDAGTQEYMSSVNRTDIPLKKVLANILSIGRERPIIIQSLFPLLGETEPSQAEIDEYVQRLKELKSGGAQISMVQIYSAHRPPNHPTCGHLPLKVLSNIAHRVRTATRLKAEVF